MVRFKARNTFVMLKIVEQQIAQMIKYANTTLKDEHVIYELKEAKEHILNAQECLKNRNIEDLQENITQAIQVLQTLMEYARDNNYQHLVIHLKKTITILTIIQQTI